MGPSRPLAHCPFGYPGMRTHIPSTTPPPTRPPTHSPTRPLTQCLKRWPSRCFGPARVFEHQFLESQRRSAQTQQLSGKWLVQMPRTGTCIAALVAPSSHCGHRARSPPSPSAGLFADEVVAQLAGACWMVCCIQCGHIIKVGWVWIWHNHAGIMLHSASGERAMHGATKCTLLVHAEDHCNLSVHRCSGARGWH